MSLRALIFLGRIFSLIHMRPPVFSILYVRSASALHVMLFLFRLKDCRDVLFVPRERRSLQMAFNARGIAIAAESRRMQHSTSCPSGTLLAVVTYWGTSCGLLEARTRSIRAVITILLLGCFHDSFESVSDLKPSLFPLKVYRPL